MINIEEYRGIQKYERPLPNDVYDLIERLNGDSRFHLIHEIGEGEESMETIVSRYTARADKELKHESKK